VDQAGQAIGIGYDAGNNAQGSASVAIGYQAGSADQAENSVAIGREVGKTAQATNCVAIGRNTAQNAQGSESVAIGYYAAEQDQGARSIAIGQQAAQDSQGTNAIAIGFASGINNQGSSTVSIGNAAAQNQQASDGIAIGQGAAKNVQGANSIAIGNATARDQQGINSIAMGHASAITNSSQHHVAIGYAAGYQSIGANNICLGSMAGSFGATGSNSCFINSSGAEFKSNTNNALFISSIRTFSSATAVVLYHNGSEVFKNSSDDRVKDGETFIKDAVKTIFNLKPQTYDKRGTLDKTDSIQSHESGFMAQDIWYDTPELRHMVRLPPTANPTQEKPPSATGDPRDDPDYSAWGPDVASIDHVQVVPYTVKAIQEIVNELPRSKTTVLNTWGQNITNLVVSANTNKHKTNTTPILTVSNVYMDKTWYGVVSDIKTDTNDYDTLVDTKGDARIWVTDVGGALVSGDIVTTSNVAPGYTQKQESGSIMNYTIAKVTQDCDFTEPEQRPIMRPKQEMKSTTIYIDVIKENVGYSQYKKIAIDENKMKEKVKVYRDYRPEEAGIEWYYNDDGDLIDRPEYLTLPEGQGSIVVAHQYTEEQFEKLNDDRKSNSTEVWIDSYSKLQRNEFTYPHPSHDITEIRDLLTEVLDENGQIVWEETGETEPLYTLVDHGTYKAALVSCKLI
jgi:hypothetical protein